MAMPVTVAVTGLHRGDNPQPGASVVRSMRRRYPGIRVVALSYDPLESGLYSHQIDHVDSVYLLPFPMKGPEVLLERMRYIHAKENFQFLVPCLDSELDNFLTIYPDLQKLGVKAMLPSKTALDLRAKENLGAFCTRRAIPGPKTFAANDVATLSRYAAEIGYPLYVKGRYYEAYLVYSQVELEQHFDAIARVWGVPILVQEALFGDEYDVVGLANGNNDVIGSCAIRKLLRTSNGKGFGGIVVNDRRLDLSVRQIIKAMRWQGPFEIEFLKMPRRPHLLFEVNPRFPAWIDFPAQIGCNLPAHMLGLLRGEAPCKLERCDAGQMFIRHSLDLVADISELAKLSSDGEYVAAPQAVAKAEIAL